MEAEITFDDFPLILGGYDMGVTAEGRIEVSDGQIVAICLDSTPELVTTHSDYLRNKESLKGLVWRGLHDQLAEYYADEINATAESYRRMTASEFV